MRRAAADGKPRPARVRYASPACRARENALRVITDASGECVPSATAAERISHSPGAWLTTFGTVQASGRDHRMSRMPLVHGWQPPGGVQPVRASPPAISYSSRASLTTVGPSGGRCLAPHSASCLGGSLSNPIGPSEPFARRISATARCGWGGRPASTHPGSAGTRWAAACDREGAATTTTGGLRPRGADCTQEPPGLKGPLEPNWNTKKSHDAAAAHNREPPLQRSTTSLWLRATTAAAACNPEGAAATTPRIRWDAMGGGTPWAAGCGRDRRCEPERTTGLPRSGRRGQAAAPRPPHHRRHRYRDRQPVSWCREELGLEGASPPRPTGGGTREW